jgi:DHA1 family tetracycline resistance protein-like MFS transporter
MPKSRRSPLLIAFVTIFLDLLGFGMIIPIQPFLAKSFGADPYLITWLGGSYSLMQFLFASFWGRLSDRFGRRPIILWSVFISVVGHFIFSQADSLAVLFFSRMLAGFGNANIGTAQAVIADVTTEKDRAKGMALMGVAFGLGFVLGPAMAGILASKFSVATPSLVASGLALLNLVFAFAFLPETRDPKTVNASKRSHFSVSEFKRALSRSGVGVLLLLNLALTTAMALMEQSIGLLIDSVWVEPFIKDPDLAHRRASLMTSWYMIAVGVTLVLVQGGLVGRVNKVFAERRILQVSVGIASLGLLLVPFLAETKIFALFVGGGAIIALGTGFFNPTNSSLLSKSVSKDDQGGTLGLNQSMAALGRVLGPLGSGLLFEQGRYWPFFVSGLVTLVSIGVSFRIKPKA